MFQEAETRTIELKEDDPVMVARMIRYLYTLDYNDSRNPTLRPGSEVEDVPATSAFDVNVHMYIMGDKFGIWGLKKTAEVKLEKAITQKIAPLEFLPLVATIYESTAENDRALRDVVVRLATLDLAALTTSTTFNEVMADVPEFACDIIKWASTNTSKPATATVFPNYCQRCVRVTVGRIEKLRCEECNFLNTASI